jgi:hypothetical protein
VRDRLGGRGNLKFLGTRSLRDILGTCRGCLCYGANKLNEEEEEQQIHSKGASVTTRLQALSEASSGVGPSQPIPRRGTRGFRGYPQQKEVKRVKIATARGGDVR